MAEYGRIHTDGSRSGGQPVLKPCPFCGGVQIEAFHHIDRGWGASWHVECVAEECGNSTCHHDTEATAIAAWNNRQPTQSDVERVARALAQADGIEICSDATYALSSYGHKAQAALAAMRQAATQERAKIVAWLHEQHDIYNPSDNWSAYWAERIEAGEHLK